MGRNGEEWGGMGVMGWNGLHHGASASKTPRPKTGQKIAYISMTRKTFGTKNIVVTLDVV